MSLKLVKKSTSDDFSSGDGTDPVSMSVTLDDSSSPATIDSDVVNAELLATTYSYTGIALSIVSEESGVDFKLSLDNTNWHDALTSGTVDDAVAGEIGNMDASGTDQRTDIYIKTVNDNDGGVSAGQHTAADIRLTATENQ